MNLDMGLLKLRKYIEQFAPEKLSDLATLEFRLKDLEQKEKVYGESDTTRKNWAEIIHSLNQMALQHTGISFNELCLGVDTPKLELSKNDLPLNDRLDEISLAKKKSARLKFLRGTFLNFPRIIGRAVFDLFGRDKAAESSAIMLGYALIILIVLVLWGVIDLNSLLDWFTGWWRFFKAV